MEEYFRVFSTARFGSSCDKNNSFVPASGYREEGGSQWVANVPLLFRIDVKETKQQSRICVSALYGVNQDLRKSTGSLEHRALTVSEWFLMVRLQTL